MKPKSSIQNIRDDLVTNVKEYFNDTTVHGFRYVVHGRNRCETIFWITLIITGFLFSGHIIYTSFSAWDETPLQTTIEKVSKPIQEYPFPAVTICDHAQLQLPRRNRWMFLEQILNWIDINEDIDGSSSETSIKTKKDFQLNLLRRTIGNILEKHNFKRFTKSCFSKTKPLEFPCKTILEYLVLNEKKNIDQNIETLYNATLKRWDDKYPACDIKHSNGYNVMKTDLFPIYKSVFQRKHESLQSNVTNLTTTDISNDQICSNTLNCERALIELMSLWERLENRIRFTSICNLGNLLSNTNFLIENWKYYVDKKAGFRVFSSQGSTMLQKSISNIMNELYPNLFVRGLSFNDMLGLLGYNSDIDFASFDSLFYKSLDYNAATSVLRPLYSFANVGGEFKGIPEIQNTKKECSLQLLYKEWINYMYHRQTLSNGTRKGMLIYLEIIYNISNRIIT